MALGKKSNPAIGNKIRAWRGATSRTRLGLALELGVAKTSVSNWELHVNEPGVEVLLSLAAISEGDYKDFFLSSAKAKSGLTSDAIQSLSIRETKKKVKGSAFAELPLIVGAAGAGPARFQDDDRVEGYISLPPSLCRNASEIKCIRIDGDSMEPTISSNTVVAVDPTQNDRSKLLGKIVAAKHDVEGVVVKRLVRINGSYRLASDNPGHAHLDMSSGWKIEGRVVWWIQTA